jgi:hypothetical protein
MLQEATPGLHFRPDRGAFITTPDEAAANLRTLPEKAAALNRACLRGPAYCELTTRLVEALYHGEEMVWPASQPVPDFVKRPLRGRISEATLNRARFSIHWNATNGTLQDVLLENDFAVAVTVNRVIVFKSLSLALSDTPEVIELWAHELTHVEQYATLGVEGFAEDYMKDIIQQGSDADPGLERDARARAARVRCELFGCAGSNSAPSWRPPSNTRNDPDYDAPPPDYPSRFDNNQGSSIFRPRPVPVTRKVTVRCYPLPNPWTMWPSLPYEDTPGANCTSTHMTPMGRIVLNGIAR